jgi:hypothetical protein
MRVPKNALQWLKYIDSGSGLVLKTNNRPLRMRVSIRNGVAFRP